MPVLLAVSPYPSAGTAYPPPQHLNSLMADSVRNRGIVRKNRKRGVEFKEGSLHDGFGGFDGFDGSAEHPALLSIVLQNTGPRDNRDGFDGFGGIGGYGGFGRDGYPP